MKKIVLYGLKEFSFRATCSNCKCVFDFMEIDIEGDGVKCPLCQYIEKDWSEKGIGEN